VGYGPDTITNAEFVALTAELAQYRRAAGAFHDARKSSSWLSSAHRAWSWLDRSGLIDAASGAVVADSLDPRSCHPRGGSITYTQGEVAEALLQLGQALRDPTYSTRAAPFLRYTLDRANGFLLHGVLQDHCEAQSPNCSSFPNRLDVAAFKGLFVLAVDDWSRSTRSKEFSAFLRGQATAISTQAILGATPRAPGCRSPHTCQFGFSWARALSPMLVTVGTQESALQALTAVLR
jgi:hypothetical protein